MFVHLNRNFWILVFDEIAFEKDAFRPAKVRGFFDAFFRFSAVPAKNVPKGNMLWA